MKIRVIAALTALGIALAPAAQAQEKGPADILNVSYDIARELYAQINPAFQAHWKKEAGQSIEVKQSHGGSSKQARSILEGLPADVVTFNQVIDVEALAKKGYVRPDWSSAFPNQASPYYSLPAFLVRKGNPKGIKNWDDLVRSDVKVIFPNPKTSGNARYTYLAAYAWGLNEFGGDAEKTQAFVKKLLSNVPVFDTGGRAATQTFAEREIGDVLVTFEAETGGIAKEYEAKGFERVTPSISLFSAFPVAAVSANAKKNGSEEVVKAYLEWLYTPEAQKTLAENFYRVTDKDVAGAYADKLPAVKLVTVDEVFGGWDKIRKEHLAEGAILDQVFVNR
jgi:sulfate transport system substrate-binding protein